MSDKVVITIKNSKITCKGNISAVNATLAGMKLIRYEVEPTMLMKVTRFVKRLVKASFKGLREALSRDEFTPNLRRIQQNRLK